MNKKTKSWLIILLIIIAAIIVIAILVGSDSPLLSPANTNPVTQGVTYKGVLDMLNKNCSVISMSNRHNESIGRTCNNLCGVRVCIGGSFEEFRIENGSRYTAYAGTLPSCSYPMYPSSFGGETSYACICCSP